MALWPVHVAAEHDKYSNGAKTKINNTITSGGGFGEVQQQTYNLLVQDKITRDEYDQVGQWVHTRAKATSRFNDRNTLHYESA
eukprot:1187542-Rhodomonas_salina.1